MEIDFLKKVLMNNSNYWVVAKRNSFRTFFEWKQGEDSIMLVSFPGIEVNLKYEEITLKHIEDLYKLRLDFNIFLNEDYPPFQFGQSLYDVYDGFSLENTPVKKFLIAALQLGSNTLYEYEKLKKEILQTNLSN